MPALAIYGRPVTPAAIDYLLQPYLPGVNSAPVLSRLVNMQFARKEAGHYYLHPVDRAYALSRAPVGDKSDRDVADTPPYTRFALLHRGAEYFRKARAPRKNWKTIDDLMPQLAEFDLRCEGQDYDKAADVLFDIDSDHLRVWGHYQLMAELHERLQGKFVLQGLIALRQRDQSAAQEAFAASVSEADQLLSYTTQNYAALDTKGLALCGLTLCDGLNRTSAAIEAYRAARAINKDAGIVARVLRLFDALAVVDSEGVLKEVRTAAAGE